MRFIPDFFKVVKPGGVLRWFSIERPLIAIPLLGRRKGYVPESR
jgi:hypothetical protein